MSSTNRGGKRSPADNYPTPSFCVHRLLERVELPGGLWYEPCAGEGAIIEAVNQVRDDVEWRATELRENGHEELVRRHGRLPGFRANCGDALDPYPFDRSDPVKVVITNPPFSIAFELLNHEMREHPDAMIALLLRINFWGSKKRQPFFEKFPADTFILPNRPSFRGAGTTDSIEYAWFIWPGQPRMREFGKVAVLALTARDEQATPLITGEEFADEPETPSCNDEEPWSGPHDGDVWTKEETEEYS
jgi:hypothetical protein